jgi:hypothetical protein
MSAIIQNFHYGEIMQQTLSGKTIEFDTQYGSLFVIVNKDDDGKVMQIFAKIGKSSQDVNGLVETIGHLASLCLQAGVSSEEVIGGLMGRHSKYPFRHPSTGEPVKSIPDAIGMSIRDGGDEIERDKDYKTTSF